MFNRFDLLNKIIIYVSKIIKLTIILWSIPFWLNWPHYFTIEIYHLKVHYIYQIQNYSITSQALPLIRIKKFINTYCWKKNYRQIHKIDYNLFASVLLKYFWQKSCIMFSIDNENRLNIKLVYRTWVYPQRVSLRME